MKNVEYKINSKWRTIISFQTHNIWKQVKCHTFSRVKRQTQAIKNMIWIQIYDKSISRD